MRNTFPIDGDLRQHHEPNIPNGFIRTEPYHTRSINSIKKAIKDDTHPISLLAIELRSITEGMTLTESMRIASLLVSMAK